MERRSIPTPPTTNDGRRLTGYAARFNTPSRVLTERGKQFREMIRPGAFSRSLISPLLGYQVALWNHGTDGRPPLGRTPTTLRLREDAEGLAFDLDLPESATDVREAVLRGDVWGMSFGFMTPTAKGEWTTRDGLPFRTLHDLDLLEISLVIFPAYPTAEVLVRDQSEVVIPDGITSPLSRAKSRLELAARAGG